LAKREWAQALGRVAPERIASALDKLVESASPWPPSLPEFIALCRVSAEDLGAPSAAEAWRIACNARGKPGTLQQRYRHPLVLAAATHPDCDLFTWSQLPEREGLARFRPVYERLLAQMANGDEFVWPEPRKDIEDRTGSAVTPREKAEARYQAKQALRAMRARVTGRSPITDWQRVHGMRRYV